MGVRELWCEQVHDESGRFVSVRVLQRDDGLLRVDVGDEGGLLVTSLTFDRDDARSLFAALGEALQDESTT